MGARSGHLHLHKLSPGCEVQFTGVYAFKCATRFFNSRTVGEDREVRDLCARWQRDELDVQGPGSKSRVPALGGIKG